MAGAGPVVPSALCSYWWQQLHSLDRDSSLSSSNPPVTVGLYSLPTCSFSIDITIYKTVSCYNFQSRQSGSLLILQLRRISAVWCSQLSPESHCPSSLYYTLCCTPLTVHTVHTVHNTISISSSPRQLQATPQSTVYAFSPNLSLPSTEEICPIPLIISPVIQASRQQEDNRPKKKKD